MPGTELSAAPPSPRSGQSFRFVDLFAGIGGVRLGLEQAGGTCLYSAELDPFARQTYAANFGKVEGLDVRQVDAIDVPDHDLLAAGFPCQPFSIAGVSKRISLGRSHGFADIGQGNLFFEIERILLEKRPRTVFLENVKNLLTHDGGNTFRTIAQILDELNYEIAYKVVDASAWVPQHRERLFIIGLHRDAYGGQAFEFPDAPIGSGPTMAAVLDDYVDQKYVLSRHLWTYLKRYAARHRAAGNGFGYGLVGPADVARTLSARYHKDGSEILIRTGGLPRRLTPRECARLMGFPERFVIPVSDTQAYRQFGNAVVVPVIAHLGRSLAWQAFQVGPTQRSPQMRLPISRDSRIRKPVTARV